MSVAGLDWGPADRSPLRRVDGGACAPSGVRAGAVAAGLKPDGALDLGLLVAEPPETTAAAVVTTNRAVAAPCLLTRRHAADGRARAVVVNSGNANACTPHGAAHAAATARAAATALDLTAEEVLVLSTGVIGVPLPVDTLVAALPDVAASLRRDGGEALARAMMTTDTRPKQVAYEVRDAAGACRVGGVAKGAGMIEPDMATMLAVLTTDAPVAPPVLRALLRDATDRTFNRISVDACGSTNDTVVALATGTADRPPRPDTLATAFEAVAADLARMVVADGEGATRIAAVRVRGAEDDVAARTLARAVVASDLVRTAIHGADPNWGRILGALGTAAAPFDPATTTVACGGVVVCRGGVAAPFDPALVADAFGKDEVAIDVVVGDGPGAVTMLTCDLSRDYVTINADYTT